MRKIIIQFTLLVAICFPVEIWAETFNTSYESIIYECETTTKSARVVGGTNATGAIVIPDKISVNGNDYAVTAIGENTDNGGICVFWGSDVTKITISEGIQEICVNALTCNTLEEVVLPQSLTTIGKYAFNGCTSLKTITIPDGVKVIGDNAFLGCTGLESASISKSVNNIGYGIFASCTKLSKITVATGNTVYDSRNECNAIIVSATNELLQGCIGTVIPSTVTRIGDSAFAGFPFTEFIIPDNIVSIGGHAFEACTSLESVTIPDGVTEIGNGAFLACISLAAIDIPSSVTSIGNNAFSYMPIVTLNIPSSVTTLGNSMVGFCENLESIRVNYINPIAISDQVFVAYDPQTWAQIGNIDATLYVPVGTKTYYENAEGWREFKKILEMNPYDVLDNNTVAAHFLDPDKDGKVEIPEKVVIEGQTYTVTTIAANAFRNNKQLFEVIIPRSVTSIGDGAFAGCGNLQAIYALPAEPISLTAEALGRATRASEDLVPSQLDGIDFDACILYVPFGSETKYRNAEGWKMFTHIVGIDPTSGIHTASTERQTSKSIYDLGGQKLAVPRYGLNIIGGKKVIMR